MQSVEMFHNNSVYKNVFFIIMQSVKNVLMMQSAEMFHYNAVYKYSFS